MEKNRLGFLGFILFVLILVLRIGWGGESGGGGGMAPVAPAVAPLQNERKPGEASLKQRVAEAVERIEAVIAQGPYHPTWESLETYQVPKWYRDAKFGIFLHWGVAAVPDFLDRDDWYPRNMYLQNSPAYKFHLATYGPQSKFGYKDFIPMFRMEKFDPRHWAELFRKAGARFVTPVAEHHDGFALYDSDLTEWDAVKMGPKRDIVGDLAAAVRQQGLRFAASSHRAEHWWFFNGGMDFDSDVRDPRYAGLYGPAQPEKAPLTKEYLDDWLARTCEIVDKYRPDLMWFDWWIEQRAFKPYLQKFAAFYYNRGVEWKRGVVINYKNEAFPERAAVLDLERGQLTGIRPLVWQTDTSVSKNSWFYKKQADYKSVDSLVGDLVDIVSKNGVLLLNIGPRPDGTIAEADQRILLGIGEWLAMNGEAIYDTRPWKIFGEGPTQVVGGSFKDTERKAFSSEDIRFTSKDDSVYAIVLACPADGRITIKSLAKGSKLSNREIQTVRLLGSGASLKWTRDSDGLRIELPASTACSRALAFKISPVEPAPLPGDPIGGGE
jgi:alpha-L-fucosidase